MPGSTRTICSVELLSIGNELLTGKTLNTNANWLSRRITELGGYVTRATTVRDSLAEIGMAIKEILKRKPSILVTSGGLGPTFDDMTLKAIANSTNRPLHVDKTVLSMIRSKYHTMRRGRKISLTKARVKMAIFPKGALALPNLIGTAPGALLEVRGSRIVCLPGVPSELRRIFEDSVAHIISDEAGGTGRISKSIRVNGIFESELAPLIDRAMGSNPGVYIKSHPHSGEGRTRSSIELDFSVELSQKAEGREKVERAIVDMMRFLSRREKSGKKASSREGF